MAVGRVLLVNVGQDVREQLVTESGAAGLMFEAVSSATDLLDDLRRSSECPDAVVLGVGIDEPVSVAQRLHLLEEDMPVIILAHPQRHATLERALRFSPFVGADVRSFSTETVPDLSGYVGDMVARTQKRKKYRRSIKAAQSRLREIGHNPPRLTHYLDRLLDKAPIGVVNIEASGRILNMNRRASTILRVSERQVLGSAITEIFPSSERPRFNEMMAHCVAPARRNPPQVFKLRPSNGATTYVEITASSLVDRSGQLGAMIILQDVSSRITAERRRAQAEEEVRKREAQLRLVTDVVPVLIAYLDRDHIYRFNNETHVEWFRRPVDEITNRPIREVMHTADYERLCPYLERAFEGQFVEYEMPFTCPDSAICHVRGNLVPDVAGGMVRGVVIIVSNITESKQAEEREKQHMLELAHVGRVVTLGELSSHLAHELAQPLTAIANFVDASLRTLKQGAADTGEILETLSDIALQSERAREIVAQLRNFIRKSELQESIENINDLVADVVRLERLEARWHDMELMLTLAPALPEVLVDKTLIEQVILNLVHNAIEAMQAVDTRGALSIETRGTRQAVIVLVSDTGPGLPGNIGRVFEPFYTTKSAGLGMGLAIARSIVEAHGGKLEAGNNEQGGATFRFTLKALGVHHDN